MGLTRSWTRDLLRACGLAIVPAGALAVAVAVLAVSGSFARLGSLEQVFSGPPALGVGRTGAAVTPGARALDSLARSVTSAGGGPIISRPAGAATAGVIGARGAAGRGHAGARGSAGPGATGGPVTSGATGATTGRGAGSGAAGVRGGGVGEGTQGSGGAGDGGSGGGAAGGTGRGGEGGPLAPVLDAAGSVAGRLPAPLGTLAGAAVSSVSGALGSLGSQASSGGSTAPSLPAATARTVGSLL